jgi:uncharacterized membrane protein
MPPIFKALATTSAWILWISGWVCGFSTFIVGIVNGDLYGAAPPMRYAAYFAVAGFFGIIAVVIMLLRKKME